MRAASFGNDLFRAVRPGFFRVLAGSNARAYADVLRALEEESTQRNEGISREEALSIVARALEDHPEFEPESDEAANGLEAVAVASLPPREQARRVLDYLARKDVGWGEVVQLPDWQRRIYFDANGTALLAAFAAARSGGGDAARVNGTVAYISGDRQGEGLFPLWSVGRNLTIGSLAPSRTW